MKRTYSVLAILFIAAITLAACGGGADPPPPPPPQGARGMAAINRIASTL